MFRIEKGLNPERFITRILERTPLPSAYVQQPACAAVRPHKSLYLVLNQQVSSAGGNILCGNQGYWCGP